MFEAIVLCLLWYRFVFLCRLLRLFFAVEVSQVEVPIEVPSPRLSVRRPSPTLMTPLQYFKKSDVSSAEVASSVIKSQIGF